MTELVTQKVIGVDSSTQSVKVVVRDAASGKLLATASRPHPDGTEVDPEAWWLAFQAAIADVGGLDSVAAISIAGQQHGMVVLDGAGQVIRPALLWNDTRSAQAAEDLNREFPEIHKLVGSKLVASFTASKLRWLRDNEPENAQRVRAVALPHDWLSWKLSGSKELSDLFTDRSDASGTGYFDPVSNTYKMEIVQAALGHSNVLLPRVLAPAEVGFDNGSLKIAPGAGDNAGGALGIGAKVGDLVISLGTSGTAFVVSATPTSDASGEVAGFADTTGNYLPLACTLNAAKVFDTTAKLLKISFEEFSELALSAESGAHGLTFLPHLDGERTPNKPDAKGALSGITHANFTPANIARAAIEGVVGSMAYAVESLSKLGVSFERIILIGGGARNPAVQVIMSEIFGQEIYLAGAGEYVADGAARQAAWVLTNASQPPLWNNTEYRVIQADKSAPEVKARYLAAISAVAQAI
jgi:xylulokinase